MRLSVNIVNFFYLPEKEYIGFLGFQHEIGHFIHLFFHIIHTLIHSNYQYFPVFSVIFKCSPYGFQKIFNNLWKTSKSCFKVNISVTHPQIVPLRH